MKKKDKIKEIFQHHGLSYLRLISHSKTAYSRSFPDHLVVFNEQIYSQNELVWKGDLDLSLDSKKLKLIANELQTILFDCWEGARKNDFRNFIVCRTTLPEFKMRAVDLTTFLRFSRLRRLFQMRIHAKYDRKLGRLVIVRKTRNGEMIFDDYGDKALVVIDLLFHTEKCRKITKEDKKILREYLQNITLRPRLDDELWLRITQGMMK